MRAIGVLAQSDKRQIARVRCLSANRITRASDCAYAHSATRLEAASSATIPCRANASDNCASYFAFRSAQAARCSQAGRQSRFLVIAPAICHHEVMRKIHGISSPRDEVAYVLCDPSDLILAVEAPTVLKIEQHRSRHGRLLRSAPNRNSWSVIVHK